VTAKFGTQPNKNNKQQLPPNYNPLELEQKIRVFWQQNNTQQKLAEYKLKYNKAILGYVEGPPTLNGYPHVGHARGRTMKDLHYRLKTMQGYYIPFWAGWDTQGLPVELEVEKQLGVRNKRQLLEQIGTDKFIQECKKAIQKYHKEWVRADQTLGIFIDQTKAYWTYKDEYIEREWQILKHAWNQQLLEEGYYVVAYCPGCQTSLSSAEVGYEGAYKTVEDPSLYFKFHKTGTENEYFLVWTTMPFTLITDTMLAVHPTAEYTKVKVDNETWILAKQRIEPVMQELGITKYQTTQTLIGKDLESTHYDYPFKDLIPKQEELEKQNAIVHTVITEEFVDINTATGVVHQAPGNGEEDFQAAQKRHTPIYAPFDDEVKFTPDAGTFFEGKFVRDTDTLVIEELRKRGLLVQAKTIKHEYPTCWRSHHKLVWLARKEYFLRTDKINEKILEAAEKVEYYYEPPKNRFISFLKEGKPWCISRERVWGAPLPIWKCQKCGHKTLIASKQELREKANEKPPSDFELHKPWVDSITLTCTQCGGTMQREDYVLDAWHNSGAAPYARFTDEQYTRFVPVDFLTEAMDQTRGWANTLLLEHVILTGKPEPPYKAFLFQGLTQDARGRKMSKSLGNVIEANKTLEKTSADVFRFYVLRKCPPTDPNDFDPQELSKRPYQVLSTLYHLSKFFSQNAEYDRFNPNIHTLEWAQKQKQLKMTDTWLLSELQETIQICTENMEKCEYNCALAALENYVIEVISRLYVPMIRRELWTDDPQTLDRRLAIYTVLWNALTTVTLLFNPVTPHLTEALYQHIHKTFNTQLAETINLEQWPKPNQQLRDTNLEQDFQTLFQAVSLGYSARQTAKIKRRWPINKMVIVAQNETLTRLKNVKDILLELSNAKIIELETKPPQEVTTDAWTTATENNIQVFLNTERDEKLLGEGLMRDLARRVQALRKELGYTPTDIMKEVKITGLDQENTRFLQPYLKQMAELVRSNTVNLTEKQDENAEWHQRDLEDKKVLIAITQ
jgi:isoleucyl-tRNA synthetase